jgi:hypothetical protein
MVTKPTGKPRGRPPKPKAEKKPRGRPAWDFRTDPDRYAVAFFELLAGLGHSERLAALSLAAFMIGNPVAVPHEIIDACPDGAVAIGWVSISAEI